MNTQMRENSLGRTLAYVCRIHHARLHALLESLGLYRGQTPLLFALWRQDGQTHSELAHRQHVKPATISRMIQRMEKNGFVERRPDADDQRVSRVFLTTHGREIRTSVQEVFAQIETEMLKGFTKEECEFLSDLLLRINQNMSDTIPDEDQE